MPQCSKCREYLPPDLCDVMQPGNFHVCMFCKEGSNVVSKDMVLINKPEAINDYRELLNSLKNSKNLKKEISNLTVEGAVKKLRKQ